uniref:Uncharacterized protein n=1 Tax=Arundo donax TaxID=35708 RepID=A0A0A9C9W1_ARUDO
MMDWCERLAWLQSYVYPFCCA